MIKVFLDMDGVLADFDKGMGRFPDLVDDTGRKYYSDYSLMFKPGFFENLPVLPFAETGVNTLLTQYNIELHIASKPIPNSYCASEKFIWVKTHFPKLVNNTHLLQDKSLLLGDYLIDDDNRWIDKFKGTLLLFDTNNPGYSWLRVFEQLKPYLKEF